MRVKKDSLAPCVCPNNLTNKLPTSIRTILMSTEKHVVVQGCLSALSDEWDDFRRRWFEVRYGQCGSLTITDRQFGPHIYVCLLFVNTKLYLEPLLLDQGPSSQDPGLYRYRPDPENGGFVQMTSGRFLWQQGPASFNITDKTDVCTLPINMLKSINYSIIYYCQIFPKYLCLSIITKLRDPKHQFVLFPIQ